MLHGKICILGTGVVINPEELLGEIAQFKAKGFAPDLRISARAHVIFPHHELIDARKGGKIGTTGRGIGPTYSQKTERVNLRILDLIQTDAEARIRNAFTELGEELIAEGVFTKEKFSEYLATVPAKYVAAGKALKRYVGDTEAIVQEATTAGKRILFEGAQGAMLDLNYGTYPFVTSCNTIAAGAYTGGGAVPGTEMRILGITKAYTTRVGAGPFPTELHGDTADTLREAGHEYGTTTGRPRRVGYLDLYALRYAVKLSGIQELAVTKIDTLAGISDLKLCTGYKLKGKAIDYFPADSATLEMAKPILKSAVDIETLAPEDWWKMKQGVRKDLPGGIQTYLSEIESFVGIPVTVLSYGPERNETIVY